MLFAELKATLKTTIAPSYVLFGSDIFLINKAIELILEAAKVQSNNVTRLDEGTDESQINANLRNISMFGGEVAVVVRGLTETRMILKPDVKAKDTVRVDCNPMTQDLVVRMILSGKKLTQDAAVYLAGACENNYARVSQELEKAVNYFKDKPAIDRTDIEQIVTKTESFQIYELSNALLKKDSARADKILQNLVESGIEDYAIFGSLVAFLRRLFYVVTSPQPDGVLAGYLKVHPYAVTSTRRDARGVSRDKAARIYADALDLEYQIKSGKISAKHAVVLVMGSLLAQNEK